LVVGFVLRVTLLIVNLEFVTLPQGGGDAIGFERKAWAHSEHGREPLLYYVQSSSEFIVLLGSYVYDVTGRAPYALGLLMVALGVGVIYLAYRAALELWGNERVARMAAWATALFPQLVLHSALFLREIPVSFCLSAAALCLIRYVQRRHTLWVIWYSFWITLGSLFHSGIIFAIPALLLGIVLTRSRRDKGKLKFYLVNIAAGVVLLGTIY